jgi:hypothetical protein
MDEQFDAVTGGLSDGFRKLNTKLSELDADVTQLREAKPLAMSKLQEDQATLYSKYAVLQNRMTTMEDNAKKDVVFVGVTNDIVTNRVDGL